MKKLIFIMILLLSFDAAAQWVARAKSTRGGDIVLLSGSGSKCTDGFRRMYVATAVGNTIWGCWMATDLHIMVVLDSGGTMAYDYGGWTMNESLESRSKPSF